MNGRLYNNESAVIGRLRHYFERQCAATPSSEALRHAAFAHCVSTGQFAAPA